MRLFSIVFFFNLVIHAATAGTTAPAVVTSIRPLHSLVSAIMQGVAEPALLMTSSQSPHHYSIKPSERRLLSEARLVFWIGPGLESFMPRLLESLDDTTRSFAMIDTPGLELFAQRTADEHAHTEHGERNDPHLWLNTHNLEVITDAISRELVLADPQHSMQYQNNADKLRHRITELRAALHRQLDGLQQPFLSYHDGYQYFEREFGLNHAGFVSTGAEIQSGAAYIRSLKKRIQQQNIQCVFYDAPIEPPLMKSLLAGSQARPVALDATGVTLPAGEDNLFQVMQLLADRFSNCLQPGR